MKNCLSHKEGTTQKRKNVEISGERGVQKKWTTRNITIRRFARETEVGTTLEQKRDIMNPDRKECLFVTVGDRSDRFFLPPLSIRTLGRLQLVFIPCLEIAARAFSSGAICIERRHSIKDNEETQREKGRKRERERYRVHFVKTRFIANRESPRFFPPPPFSIVRFNETEQNRRRPLMHIHHDRFKPNKRGQPPFTSKLQVLYDAGFKFNSIREEMKARFFNPISIMNRQYLL